MSRPAARLPWPPIPLRLNQPLVTGEVPARWPRTAKSPATEQAIRTRYSTVAIPILVRAVIRIGAGTAHVMKGDLDAAAGQLGAVTTLDPPFRIANITGYLADMDSLLAQRRFAGDRKAGELREQIRVFTAAACPAAPAAALGLEDR
jgi:hypothetical protein